MPNNNRAGNSTGKTKKKSRKGSSASSRNSSNNNSSGVNINTSKYRDFIPNKKKIAEATKTDEFGHLFKRVMNCVQPVIQSNCSYIHIDKFSEIINDIHQKKPNLNMSGGSLSSINDNSTVIILLFIILCMICFMYKCMNLDPKIKSLPKRVKKAVKSGAINTQLNVQAKTQALAEGLAHKATVFVNRFNAAKNVLKGLPTDLSADEDPELFGHEVTHRPYVVRGPGGRVLTGARKHTRFGNNN